MKYLGSLLLLTLIVFLTVAVALYLYLSSSGIVVSGIVTDAVSGQPLAGLEITAGNKSVQSDVHGRYIIADVPREGIVSAVHDGYHAAQGRATTDSLLVRRAQLDLALQPVILEGIITDAASDQPVAGASISVGGQAFVTGEDGRYRFVAVQQNAPITIRADGFAAQSLQFNGESVLPITLDLNTVVVDVVDDSDKSLIINAILRVAGHEIAREGQGRFVLRGVKQQTTLAAQADGYLPAAAQYSGETAMTVTLTTNTVSGLVQDQYTGKPLTGVTVTLQQVNNTRSTLSDHTGSFQFRRVAMGARVTATSPDHAAATLTYTGQISLPFTLRPSTLRGFVRDARNRQPLAGAAVSVGDVTGQTDVHGEYRLTGIPASLPLIVSAKGYDQWHAQIDRITTLDVDLWPSTSIRAIYIPFYLLTIPERVHSLIAFADRAGMNGIVVDVKGDDGYLAYDSALPLAREIKARYQGKMMAIGDVLAEAKKRNMYTIARMVVFKDNVLAEARPDLAVRDKRTNQIWDDCGNGSTYWADPFRKEVVEYNVGIAEEMGRLGFDEIQFDYIRFPPACVSVVRLANASYAMTSTMETRLAAIETFLAAARERLRPLGVAIAVDTFGWTLMRDDDLAIGQRMENMAKYVDYISPMVYPSTWEPGALGIPYPPAQPYELIYRTLTHGLSRLKETNVKIRPWLQDFDDYQHQALPYGLKELDEQRRASADAGAVGWMLWNAGGVYTEETAGRP